MPDVCERLLADVRIKVELNEPAAASFAEFRAAVERHHRVGLELRQGLDEVGLALRLGDVLRFRAAAELLERLVARG
jgi:hypothetical protein